MKGRARGGLPGEISNMKEGERIVKYKGGSCDILALKGEERKLHLLTFTQTFFQNQGYCCILSTTNSLCSEKPTPNSG